MLAAIASKVSLRLRLWSLAEDNFVYGSWCVWLRADVEISTYGDRRLVVSVRTWPGVSAKLLSWRGVYKRKGARQRLSQVFEYWEHK